MLHLIQLQIRFIFMIFIRQTASAEDKLLFSICLFVEQVS